MLVGYEQKAWTYRCVDVSLICLHLRRLRKDVELYVTLVDLPAQAHRSSGIHLRLPLSLRDLAICRQGRCAEPSLPSVPFKMLVATESNECRVNLSGSDKSESKTLASLVRGGSFKMSFSPALRIR